MLCLTLAQDGTLSLLLNATTAINRDIIQLILLQLYSSIIRVKFSMYCLYFVHLIIWQDLVCIDTQQRFCANNFKFFGILDQEGLDGIDGILGLSPDMQGNGPSFIGQLKL
jgi:hypothetical protein